MRIPLTVSKVLFKHDERVRLAEKFNSLPQSIIEDAPAAGKNLSCKVLRTEDVKDDLKPFFEYARTMNEAYFGFKVHDWPISVNWNTYGVGNEYKFHVDCTPIERASDIKLTVITDLSTEPYTGGEFEFYWHGQHHVVGSFGPGTIAIFPSYVHHSVRPIKSGTRRSLSMWWQGPNWT